VLQKSGLSHLQVIVRLRHSAPPHAWRSKKSPAVRQGVRGSCNRLLCVVDRRLEFRSGLLRLIAVVEGEQRLPRSAEMLGTEGVERMRPLRCEQPLRCERLDLLTALGIEVRPERQLGARRPEADKGGKTPAVRIAGLHEIGPVGLYIGRQRRLRGGERRAEVEDVREFGCVLRSRGEA
jgi:hypothetical protein